MDNESKWLNDKSKIISIKTYMKCNSFLKQMLGELEIEPIAVAGGPKATNLALVQQVKSLLKKSDEDKLVEISSILEPGKNVPLKKASEKTRVRLAEKLDNIIDSAEDSTPDVLTSRVMIDDISPNAFKQSLIAVVENYLATSHTNCIFARELFRRVLDDLQARNVVRRKINVVSNNFPRMHGYLVESYDDQIGISSYGRGKNLNTAKVRIG
jgi:hypothetical protein